MTGSILRKRADRFSESTIEDEVVVMRLDNGDFYSLTGSSRVVWESIDGTRDLQQIVALSAERYDLSAEDIASDVAHFVGSLLEAGLVAEG